MVDFKEAANIEVKIIPSLIPEIETRILCAVFLEAITTSYEHEDHIEQFQKWLIEEKGGKTDG